MAPKKKSAPKKTKQQREEEKKAQEEAEAKLQAEELQRLEEERKCREEEDSRNRELDARNRAVELSRLNAEEETFRDYNQTKLRKLDAMLKLKKEEKDWERYLACDPRPAADSENDMNAFINAWLMESSVDIAHVAECCEKACSVMDDLSVVGSDAMTANNESLYQQSMSYIRYLKKHIHGKLEASIAHILQFADEFAGNTKNELKLSSNTNTKRIKVGIWVNLNPKSSRSKRIEFNSLGIGVDLPKSIVLQGLALQVSFLPFDLYEDENMHNENESLGGVFSIELLQLHPPPLKARGWIIRQAPTRSSNSDSFMNKRIAYPLDGTVASAALPIRVSVNLPPHLIMDADVRIGWWDRIELKWQEDGINDMDYNAATHDLVFTTTRLGNMAILRPRNLHSKRSSWVIRVNKNIASTGIHDTAASSHSPSALLIIKTARYECIRIEISENGCRLLEISQVQLHGQLDGTLLSPSELMAKLYASGIGLCQIHTHDHNLPFKKLQHLEDQVIREITSITNAFEVCAGNLALIRDEYRRLAWAKLAAESESNIVFAVREMFWSQWDEDGSENPVRAPFIHVLASVDQDAPGSQIKFTLDHAVVDSTDTLERNGLPSSNDTYMHLRNALGGIATSDAQARMEQSNELYEYTMYNLLALLRIFSCSEPAKSIS